MKKTLSLLLILVLVLSLCSFAAADEERQTVTIALALNTNVVDYDTNAYTLALEDEFNVNIEFMLMEDIKEKLPIIVSSGSALPDMICGTLDDNLVWNWAQQGVLVPLTEYWKDPEMTKHLTNRVADLECDPALVDDMLANITMPDGEIYTLPKYDENFWNCNPFRLFLNMDWLEAAGMPVPTTIDELRDVLIYFRDHDMNGNGDLTDEVMLTGGTGWGYDVVPYLMSAFIHATVETKYINVENGKVIPAYTQDAFKAGLEYIHGMYAEGLIDPLAFTQDTNQIKALLNADEMVIGSLFTPSSSTLASERLSCYQLIGPVAGPEGVCFAPTKAASITGLVYVTCDAKDPALCFKMAEINYDTFWRARFRNGVEGEQWTADPEIIRQYKLNFQSASYDKVLLVVTENVWGAVNNVIWNSENMPFFGTEESIINSVTTKKVADLTEEELNDVSINERHYQLYFDHRPAEVLGSLIYTTDELDRLADIKAAIDSYAAEMITAFIVGNESLDNWDHFQTELVKMGLEEYVTIMQAAYDRKGA